MTCKDARILWCKPPPIPVLLPSHTHTHTHTHTHAQPHSVGVMSLDNYMSTEEACLLQEEANPPLGFLISSVMELQAPCLVDCSYFSEKPEVPRTASPVIFVKCKFNHVIHLLKILWLSLDHESPLSLNSSHSLAPTCLPSLTCDPHPHLIQPVTPSLLSNWFTHPRIFLLLPFDPALSIAYKDSSTSQITQNSPPS